VFGCEVEGVALTTSFWAGPDRQRQAHCRHPAGAEGPRGSRLGVVYEPAALPNGCELIKLTEVARRSVEPDGQLTSLNSRGSTRLMRISPEAGAMICFRNRGLD
jgi:hypothetical protein